MLSFLVAVVAPLEPPLEWGGDIRRVEEVGVVGAWCRLDAATGRGDIVAVVAWLGLNTALTASTCS